MSKKSKAEKRAEKQGVQQERSGIFRDRKRRIFYIDPKTKEGYQILNNRDNFIYIYDGRALFTLLPLALTHAFIKMNTVLMGLLALVIYYGITFYYQYKVLPSFKHITTLPDEVVARSQSAEVLSARKTDLLLKALMGVLIIIIIMTNAVQMQLENTLSTMQTTGITLSTFVAVLVLFDTIGIYLKVRKASKG